MSTATFLVIAVLVNGGLQTESVYSMENLAECEAVSRHQAVIDSYPDRELYCVETGTDARPPGTLHLLPAPNGRPKDTARRAPPFSASGKPP